MVELLRTSIQSRSNKDWEFLLKDDQILDSLGCIPDYVIHSDSEHTVLPDSTMIFRAFELCTFENLKVVLLSQDPYPNRNVPDGLAFSSKTGRKIPASLLNIYKALENDQGLTVKFQRPDHYNLEAWAKQGILLLNTGLTVPEGSPGEYLKHWTPFTDRVIQLIAERKKNVVFILWGAKAKAKEFLVKQFPLNNHNILNFGHPSPLGRCDFPTCKNFSQCNQFLQAWKLTPIDWNLNTSSRDILSRTVVRGTAQNGNVNNVNHIIEEPGDLFQIYQEHPDVNVLVHCIANDKALGKGIAKTFCQKYPGLKETLQEFTDSKIGDAIILSIGAPFHNLNQSGRPVSRLIPDLYIGNLITKPVSTRKLQPEQYLSTLKIALQDLYRQLLQMPDHRIIAMPKIGSGLDGMEWSEVLKILKEITPSVFTVYIRGN